jgi:hypothetical protein
MVPSSNGQDIWFSSIKSGFDYPWDYNEMNNTYTQVVPLWF